MQSGAFVEDHIAEPSSPGADDEDIADEEAFLFAFKPESPSRPLLWIQPPWTGKLER